MIKHIKPKTISLGINRIWGSMNIGDYNRNTAELNRF